MTYYFRISKYDKIRSDKSDNSGAKGLCDTLVQSKYSRMALAIGR